MPWRITSLAWGDATLPTLSGRNVGTEREGRAIGNPRTWVHLTACMMRTALSKRSGGHVPGPGPCGVLRVPAIAREVRLG